MDDDDAHQSDGLVVSIALVFFFSFWFTHFVFIFTHQPTADHYPMESDDDVSI